MNYFIRTYNRIPNIWKETLLWFVITRGLFTFIGTLARIYIVPLNPNFHWWLYKWVPLSVWGVWDSGWYLPLAKYGYSVLPSTNSLTLGQANTAFFPLYPLLMHILGKPTDYFLAGIFISNLSLIIGSVGLYNIAKYYYSEDVGIRSVRLLYLFPFGFLFSAVLTEGLFFALSTWSVYFATQNKLFKAGILAFFLALTRPTGLFILIPLLIIAYKNGGKRTLLVYSLAPSLGLLSYMGYLWVISGDPLSFTHIQTAWNRHLDFPPYVVLRALLHGGLADKLNACVAGISFFALFIYRKKIPSPLLYFSFAVLLFPLATGIASFARYSLAAFPLFILLGLISKDERVYLILSSMGALLAASFFVLWTSGFTLII